MCFPSLLEPQRDPFPGSTSGKELTCQCSRHKRQGGVRSLGWEDPPKEGVATHSSILAWRIPWTVEPGRLQPMGSQRVRHDWSDLACKHGGILKAQIPATGDLAPDCHSAPISDLTTSDPPHTPFLLGCAQLAAVLLSGILEKQLGAFNPLVLYWQRKWKVSIHSC